ncbi:non-hydrolyzing UDP-N-acetylglucosamine 2-epimerase [Microbacterium sp. NPDC055312]
MMKILLVFGTRPEAIKMCPVVNELKSRSDVFDVVVCVTGQHRQMLDQVLDVFGVIPDHDLSIMKHGQDLLDVTTEVMKGIRPILASEQPDLVLVHGDTTTSFAAALAAFYLRLPVGHVEAGLRTGDLTAPFPEEFNRLAVDVVAEYYFAPTGTAKENLLREGKPEHNVFVTGNTVIDALKTTVDVNYAHPLLEWVGQSRMILITAHRRENLGEPMRAMFRAIRRLADATRDAKFIFPVHMNPRVRRDADDILGNHDRIRVIEPLDAVDFHNFMARSVLILTDSGGIQEEAPSLGVPVLVMRSTTERPEGVEAGTLRLVGTNEESIFSTAWKLLHDADAYAAMSGATNPYGDGSASRKIADIISSQGTARHAQTPL